MKSLKSLSRQYGMDPLLLRKLNHVISPAELYVGYQLVLIQQDQREPLTTRASLNAGETLLELAVKGQTDPWTLAKVNGLSGPVAALPTDTLYLPSEGVADSASGLPAPFASAQVDPLPLIQGATVQVKVVTTEAVTLGGTLGEYPLYFYQASPDAENPDLTQVALQGIHSLLEPGLYPLRLDATLPDGSTRSFEQPVLVRPGDFLTEVINGVEPDTIDPAITEPETEWLLSVVSNRTPQRYWQGQFVFPVDSQFCLLSRYGNRRTFNAGAYSSFHTGLDFGVCSESHPRDIYAPADGTIVFTGLKTVRGNVTIIDHGQGIFSGIFHQEELYVEVGDFVSAGQLIGMIGATGRVTGPHLHWEVWVNGVQVNPDTWLDFVFPH